MADDSYTLDKVQLNTKLASDRLQVMDHGTGQLVAVPDDYERWMIAAPDALKKKTIQYTEKDLPTDTQRVRQRNKISEQFTNNRLALLNADQQYFSSIVSNQNELAGELTSTRVYSTDDSVPSQVSDLASDITTPGLDANHRQTHLRFSLDLLRYNLNIESFYNQSVAKVQRQRGYGTAMADYLSQKEPDT